MEKKIISNEVYSNMLAEIQEDLEAVLNNSPISGIKLYTHVYYIVTVKSFAIDLYKFLYKFLTKICIKISIKVKKEDDQCKAYTHEFNAYTRLVRVLREMFVSLDELLIHRWFEGATKDSISTEAIKIFVVNVIVETGIIDLLNLMLQNELQKIISNLTVKKAKLQLKLPSSVDLKAIQEINNISIDKLPREYSILLIYNSIIFDETQKNTKLITALNTLKEFKIYRNSYENYAIICIKYQIINLIKRSTTHEEFITNSCSFFEAIKLNLSKILLKESFIKIIKILDEELIFNYKIRIAEPLINKLLVQINHYKNTGIFINDEMYITSLYTFPYFSIILEEIVLKLIIFFKSSNIYDCHENFIIFKKINSSFLFNKYDKSIKNAFSNQISQFIGAEEQFVIHIHKILLSARNKQEFSCLFSFSKDFNISEEFNQLKKLFFSNSDWQIINDFLKLINKPQNFYDKYLIYLEKRLFIGETVFEKEVIHQINIFIPNHSFSAKAYKMIEEIENNSNIHSINVLNNAIKLQFLLVNEINFTIPNRCNIDVPDWLLNIQNEALSYMNLPPNRKFRFDIYNDYCLVSINNQIIQMTLLHYLVLLDYQLNLPLTFINQIKDSLKNINPLNILELPILEKQEEGKDFYTICKAALLRLLKREKQLSKQEIIQHIQDDNLEKVLEECIKQGYIQNSNDFYEYLP